ncbi:MAG TPA: vanadium-dependent haloperoxidase [Candidatus Limnocylindrales bacterium]|nr:vanadium-dependent haloperoxidase [Candidatus Limnocylindrales bacterium]
MTARPGRPYLRAVSRGLAAVVLSLLAATASPGRSIAGVPLTTTTVTEATTTTVEPATTTTLADATTTTTLVAATTTTTLPIPPDFEPIRQCGDASGDGVVRAGDALLILNAAVENYDGCSAMVCDATGGINGVNASDALVVLKRAVEAVPPSALRCPSAARLWMEQLLAAIRLDIPRPTVHARNLFHLSVAMWDAWVAYDHKTSAAPYLFAEKPEIDPDVYTARSVAISYASYRILTHRFVVGPGHVATQAHLDAAMDALGFDRSFTSTEGDNPAAVGNRIAATVIAYGASDGANEANNYADDSGYVPVNEPLYPALSGATMVDPNRWQPLSLKFTVTQNGIPLPITKQTFICPHWGEVKGFALVPVDPGPPPQLGGEGDQEFKNSALEVVRYSSRLDPADGVAIDISPGAKGNSDLGTNNGTGHPLNPATGQPYAPQVVKRADWARVLAEFWADGPDSETPPGHWNVIADYVADHPLFEKRLGGTGDVLDNLQWDVKVYLAINGAVHDAAISAWGNKGIYDSARPISMIRYMAALGQSSNPDGPSYDPNGIPLEDGVVEVITSESAAPGGRHAHLAEHVGEIAIRAWLGNPEHPDVETGGVGWILGIDWVPYQKDTFVTPAFAGYFSGHSTFSRSAAEAMTQITGTPFFPGGLAEFHAAAHQFLTFEDGPTTDVTLEWATYQDAADEAGLSRLYGGIHIRADDFTGRILGYDIGRNAAALAKKYWDGTVDQ